MGLVRLLVLVKDTKAKSDLKSEKATRNDLRALLEQIKIMEHKIIKKLEEKSRIFEKENK